ncbi:MAG: D-alanyl-D-alanine carboxypeptidase/D-alanyl-D-alanine-endopeptidase, partial [Thermoanaerobaculia bacterium]
MSLSERLLLLTRRPPILPRSEFSVAVARVGESEPILSVNGDAPLILASTTKVFTTASALDRLGLDYKFKTRVYRDAAVGEDGILPGHLVIVGGGDPAISGRLFDDDPLAVFRPWAASLAKQGIRQLKDGLLLDVSFFDDVRVHPDWPAEQEQNWWQAPTSALSYNDNVVLVRATGGLRPGAPALLGFYPAGPPLLSLIGQVMTAAGRGARVGVRRTSGSHTVVAQGLVGRNRTWTGDVTVPDPPLYMAAALSQVLRENGIQLGAPPKVQTEPLKVPTALSGRVLLHTHETPILPVLSVCNKRSQSFYAEQILKTLGAETRGVGTWSNGEKEVSAFLQRLGLDPDRYRLVDGSGRSRSNMASAQAYLDFLKALATKWSKFDAFQPSLAISGDMQ